MAQPPRRGFHRRAHSDPTDVFVALRNGSSCRQLVVRDNMEPLMEVSERMDEETLGDEDMGVKRIPSSFLPSGDSPALKKHAPRADAVDGEVCSTLGSLR